MVKAHVRKAHFLQNSSQWLLLDLFICSYLKRPKQFFKLNNMQIFLELFYPEYLKGILSNSYYSIYFWTTDSRLLKTLIYTVLQFLNSTSTFFKELDSLKHIATEKSYRAFTRFNPHKIKLIHNKQINSWQ